MRRGMKTNTPCTLHDASTKQGKTISTKKCAGIWYGKYQSVVRAVPRRGSNRTTLWYCWYNIPLACLSMTKSLFDRNHSDMQSLRLIGWDSIFRQYAGAARTVAKPHDSRIDVEIDMFAVCD